MPVIDRNVVGQAYEDVGQVGVQAYERTKQLVTLEHTRQGKHEKWCNTRTIAKVSIGYTAEITLNMERTYKNTRN